MFDPSVLAHIDKQIQSATTEWQHKINAAAAAIDWDAFRESVRDASERLAALGWTLPMQLSPMDIIELAGAPIEEAEAVLVAFYTEDEFKALRRVRQEILARPALSDWKTLLDECFEVFEAGKHLVTVPALISTIEGVVARAANSSRKQSVSSKFLASICADKAKASASPSSIEALMWRSLQIFIEKLFQHAPFDKSRPPVINRHWILHGRDSSDWTIVDSLRLFCALETVDSLLE
jgi:hypothetical protein